MPAILLTLADSRHHHHQHHVVELEMCLRSQVAYVVNLEVILEVNLEACLMWSS